MRISRVVLVLVLVAACIVAVVATRDDGKPSEPDAPPRGPALFSGKWGSVGFEDVALSIPVEFGRQTDYGKEQRIFLGPEINGFRASVQVIRQSYGGTTRQWFGRWRDKYLRGPRGITKVIESGPARVAGSSGYVLVYQIPQGDRIFINIAWLWVRNGHGYIVRGLAEKESFVAVYRDVFEKVKSTVRLVP